ncbi:MAG TPA: hypothetical protein VK978_03580 [Candidatus Saccharimonadales bacterium]|nr:hypothetical protein [Candidatus Saccharimonadales bacterium]
MSKEKYRILGIELVLPDDGALPYAEDVEMWADARPPEEVEVAAACDDALDRYPQHREVSVPDEFGIKREKPAIVELRVIAVQHCIDPDADAYEILERIDLHDQ